MKLSLVAVATTLLLVIGGVTAIEYADHSSQNPKFLQVGSTSSELESNTPPPWFRYNMPWWAAMYPEEQRQQLVNPSAMNLEPPMNLPGYEWVKHPPKNAVPVLLPSQSSGIGRIMLEQESTVTPSAASLSSSSSTSAPAFVETEAEVEAEVEGEQEHQEKQPIIVVNIQPGSITAEPATPPSFKRGHAWKVKGTGSGRSKKLTMEALAGKDSNKLNTNLATINKAEDLAITTKADLAYLRAKTYADAMRSSFAEVDAEAGTDAEMEAETQAEVEVDAEDLPPVNPHMIPIPEAVHDMIVNMENAPPAGYPTTPVYIVEKPGVAFVPNGETFQARVGPGGAQMATHILERAGNIKKNKKDIHTFNAANTLEQESAEKLKFHRATINNMDMTDPKSSPEVEADLKPVVQSFVETSAGAGVDTTVDVDAESALEQEMEQSMETDMESEMEAQLEIDMKAEAQLGAELEADAQAQAEAELEDLPPVNPHMIPIPEAVHDMIVNMENAPPAGYPTTPVYIVEKPGVAFVPNGETFQARVGPGGAQMATHILERAGNIKKNKKDIHTFNAANTLEQESAEKLKFHRATINNMDMTDPKSSPEVEADLKPVVQA